MTGLMNSQGHSVVVVLGSGRSGTSLLMQVMFGFGLQVSENLIPANVSNTEGFFEDLEIKDIQADLYACLNVPISVPLPESWLDTDCARLATKRLTKVLSLQLETASGIFGIKDPRISTFLPLWTRVFNPLRVVPKYILAVRQPSSVIVSFIRQYNTPGHVAELIWLLRTVEALENTAADCFIAHYEDWFNKPESLAQGLLDYTGLGQTLEVDVSEILAKTIKSNLNRASKEEYEVKNPYVLKLYEVLKTCSGAEFDCDFLMATVRECRRVMDGFKGWYELAQNANKKLMNTQSRLEKATADLSRVKPLEDQIQLLENEKSQSALLGVQVHRLERQLNMLLSLEDDSG